LSKPRGSRIGACQLVGDGHGGRLVLYVQLKVLRHGWVEAGSAKGFDGVDTGWAFLEPLNWGDADFLSSEQGRRPKHNQVDLLAEDDTVLDAPAGLTEQLHLQSGMLGTDITGLVIPPVDLPVVLQIVLGTLSVRIVVVGSGLDLAGGSFGICVIAAVGWQSSLPFGDLYRNKNELKSAVEVYHTSSFSQLIILGSGLEEAGNLRSQ
jgi:hypothetical protein